jgi:hypothetical protein
MHIRQVLAFFCASILMTITCYGQSGSSTCTGSFSNGDSISACTIPLGSGKLTFNATSFPETCQENHNVTVKYTLFTQNGFVYTDPGGNSSSLPLNFSRITGSNGLPACPKSTSLPASAEVALTGNIADFGNAITFLPPSEQASITSLDVGSMGPKYMVVTVIYAPPGSGSNVIYSTTTMTGTTISFSSTFMNANTVSQTVGLKAAGIPAIMGSSVSEDFTFGFTQSSSTGGSIAFNKSATNTIQVNGPANSSAGVDHDFDQIILWLNPVLEIEQFGNNVILAQGGFDPRDPTGAPTGEVDTIQLFVKDIKDLIAGTFTGDPDIPARLARTWAGSGQGITAADLATILARDPFANGSTTIDPTRFTVTGDNFTYGPPPDGGQPDKFGLTLNYLTTSTESTGASDSYSVGVTFDVTQSFAGILTNEMKNSNTLTWTNTNTLQTSQASGQTAAFNMQQPPVGYTGPTDLVVYQDNIYGTFFFNLIP